MTEGIYHCAICGEILSDERIPWGCGSGSDIEIEPCPNCCNGNLSTLIKAEQKIRDLCNEEIDKRLKIPLLRKKTWNQKAEAILQEYNMVPAGLVRADLASVARVCECNARLVALISAMQHEMDLMKERK